MGPLADLRARPRQALAVAGLLAGLVVGLPGACQGKKGPEITDSDRVFPLPVETDLVVHLTPGAARSEVRRITVDLALRDGVEATEAHYDNGEIRVVVSRDMSTGNRNRLRSLLLEAPEVASVEVEVPED